MLASLEQFILVNSKDLLYTDPDRTVHLLNLYGLYRTINYQISHSPEAERILLHLASENEWDLPFARIHCLSLKWLFKQEQLSEPLTHQILKFSQSNSSNEALISVQGDNSQFINLQVLAELAASGDNYVSKALVCLLMRLVGEEGQEHDIISVLNLVTAVISICPAASYQLCRNGLGNAIRALYYSETDCSSHQMFIAISCLLLNILRSVHPEALSDDEVWLALTLKVLLPT